MERALAQSSGAMALELSGVTKRYRLAGKELMVLDQVDLMLAQGGKLALVGPSGRASPRSCRGIIFQQYHLIPTLTALENVMLLADEPTGNLDEESAAEVMALIQELARMGR